MNRATLPACWAAPVTAPRIARSSTMPLICWNERVKITPTEVIRKKKIGRTAIVAHVASPAQHADAKGKSENPGTAIASIAKRWSDSEEAKRVRSIGSSIKLPTSSMAPPLICVSPTCAGVHARPPADIEVIAHSGYTCKHAVHVNSKTSRHRYNPIYISVHKERWQHRHSQARSGLTQQRR